MFRLIATTAIAATTAITMSVTEVQADKLPASVSSQLQLATGPHQIALLAIAYPDLAVSIMEEAASLGLSTPAQVVGAAVSLEASPAVITQLTHAAATATPHQANTATALAAELCVTYGEDIPYEFAPALATAAVDGVEASGALAEVIESEAAEILAALEGWCGQPIKGLAGAIAAATNDKNDTPEDILAAMNYPTGSEGDGHSTLAQNGPITLEDFLSGAQGIGAKTNEAENNPSPN